MIVIGISENAIIFLGVKILIDKSEIADYLTKAKKLIVQNKFSIALNSNRMTNLSLFDEYLIDEERIKIILLDLTEDDFCEKVQNKHVQFQHEWLYIFGKEISLMMSMKKKVKWSLYIKFNMIENKFVIVISFHKQKYPLVYYFR